MSIQVFRVKAGALIRGVDLPFQKVNQLELATSRLERPQDF